MAQQNNFGVVDNRFLARSIGLLNPKPPVTIGVEQTIGDALRTLKANKIGCLVVIDEVGKLLGIFTERDVVLKLDLGDPKIGEAPITQYMTPNPHTEQMTTTIAYSLNLMSQGGYRHLPIVDDENFPVGIVSVKDIVDYISDQLNRDLGSVSGMSIDAVR